jgi:hypothetical protein
MSDATTIFKESFGAAVAKHGDPVPVKMTSFRISYKEGGPRLYNNDGDLLLTLSPEAEGNLPQTRYQAAHEAVHVLCGLPPSATGLEEGVAVVFSEECVKRVHSIDASDVVRNSAKYKRARDLVKQLIEDGANVKALRTETGGRLSGGIITPAFLQEKFANLSEKDAVFLATPDPAFR